MARGPQRLLPCALGLLLLGLPLQNGLARQARPAPAPKLSLLTTTGQIRSLGNRQADLGYPVRLHAVVTYYGGEGWELFVQDKTGGIYVVTSGMADLNLHAGERVELTGRTAAGYFAPDVVDPKLRVLGHAPLPPPHKATYGQLDSGALDCQWVEIEGIIQRASELSGQLSLSVVSDGDRFAARLPAYDPRASRLVDAKVLLQGVAAGLYNGKDQFVGFQLDVPGLKQVRVEEPGTLDPYSLPIRQIRTLSRFRLRRTSVGHRTRIQGVVEYQRAGKWLVVQDQTGSLLAGTLEKIFVEPGDRVDVAGFITLRNYSPGLEDAVFRKIGSGPPPIPRNVSPQEAISGAADTGLVRMRARLLDVATHAGLVDLTVRSGNVTYDADLYRSGNEPEALQLRAGSLLELTGVCLVDAGSDTSPGSFTIYLRSPEDVVVLRLPPWWSTRRILWALAAAGFIILVSLVWLYFLRRKIKEQTALLREWVRRESRLKWQYKELFENANDLVFTMDLTGNLTSLNRTGELLTGYSRSQALGTNLSRILPAEYRPVTQAMLESKLRGGPPTTYEIEILAKDGRRLPLEVSSRLIFDGEKPSGIQGIARDISERKRALESLSLLASIVGASYDAIIGVTPEGIVVSWNPAAEKLYGYSASEAIGRHISMVFPLDDKDKMDEILDRLRHGERITNLEGVRVRKDGSLIHVSLNLSEIRDSAGKVTGLCGIVRDVTAQKQIEEEQQKTKLLAEAASRAKSEFLANMSHEIRTPLNGIIGMTELALDTSLTPEQREYLAMVKTSASNLLAVINDVLDFSKIEARRLGLDPIEINLRDHLAETLQTMAFRAHQQGLELALRVDPAVPSAVVADPSRLRQIVVNLVANAIKFTERGEVVVEVVRHAANGAQADLCFSVSDTGVGIPEEKQRLIFEPFTQVDSSATRRHGGTGLGLAISSQLVELMGGRLSVESVSGQGSRFYFTIRLDVPDVPVEAPARDLEGLPVLVVDDNTANRSILVEMMARWGMVTAAAGSGPLALNMAQVARQAAKPFSLIVVDAHMPGMDGFTLIQRLRQNPDLAGTTVLLLTSAGQRGDGTRCRELGVAVYLHKPVKESDLFRAALLALGRPLGQAGAPPLITRHSLRKSPGPLRVLLAEDDPVSRELALRLLQKRGHSVETVSNGFEVLDALERFGPGAFHVLLMDVQMPGLDGPGTTAAIREREKTTRTHLPIIAVTAHALKGDSSRLLDAGMDGYISKPIDAERIFEAVELLGSAADKFPLVGPPQDPAGEVFNEEEILNRVGGDNELLQEMIDLFLRDCPNLVSAVERAAAQRDAAALEQAAHKLKGTVSNFSAPAAYDAALRLEVLGRQGETDQSAEALAILEEQLERLKTGLAAFSRDRND